MYVIMLMYMIISLNDLMLCICSCYFVYDSTLLFSKNIAYKNLIIYYKILYAIYIQE